MIKVLHSMTNAKILSPCAVKNMIHCNIWNMAITITKIVGFRLVLLSEMRHQIDCLHHRYKNPMYITWLIKLFMKYTSLGAYIHQAPKINSNIFLMHNSFTFGLQLCLQSFSFSMILPYFPEATIFPHHPHVKICILIPSLANQHGSVLWIGSLAAQTQLFAVSLA